MRNPLPTVSGGVFDADGGMHLCQRDYETRSTLALKRVGTHTYAADPCTEVLCCAYAIDDQPVQLWIPGDKVPPEIVEAADNPDFIALAHGDPFETAVERHIMAPRFDWPEIPLDRHICTMSMALALGLPARLSAAADALELADRKDMTGERLMHQMSKPRRLGKTKIQIRFIGLMTMSACGAFIITVAKMSKQNVRCLVAFRPYLKLSTQHGS